MSRELVLLPKSKYEELLQTVEKSTRKESSDSEKELDSEETKPRDDIDNQKQTDDEHGNTSHELQVTNKDVNLVDDGENSNPYVHMNPMTFLRRKKETKKKWMKFSF